MAIYFEISALAAHLEKKSHYSGIQRVTIELARDVARLRGEAEVFLLRLDGTDGPRRLPVSPNVAELLKRPDLSAALLGSGDLRKRWPFLKKYHRKPLKFAYHRARFRVYAHLGRRESFARLKRGEATFDQVREMFAIQRGRFWQRCDGQLGPQDHVVMIDRPAGAAVVRALHRLKDRGPRIALMIHDLIPLNAPRLVPPRSPAAFLRFLQESAGYVDGYLANSIDTARDLRAFLAARGIDRQVTAVPLAQARFTDETGQGEGEDDIDAMAGLGPLAHGVAHLPFALCVGTRETRKNHWRLLRAWQRLRDEGVEGLPRLVLAGGPGWYNAEADDLLAATGNLGGWVSVLDAPDDRTLDHLYRTCEFVVMVSLAEGWGLPVGEALAHGKPCLVSRVNSLPEVGQDLVAYCDPISVVSIADGVAGLLSDERRAAMRAKIATSALRSWMDVARDLVDALDARRAGALDGPRLAPSAGTARRDPGRPLEERKTKKA